MDLLSTVSTTRRSGSAAETSHNAVIRSAIDRNLASECPSGTLTCVNTTFVHRLLREMADARSAHVVRRVGQRRLPARSWRGETLHNRMPGADRQHPRPTSASNCNVIVMNMHTLALHIIDDDRVYWKRQHERPLSW